MTDAFQAVRLGLAPKEVACTGVSFFLRGDAAIAPDIGGSRCRGSRFSFRALGVVRINLLLGSHPGLLIPQGHVTPPLGSHEPVPEDEERLGEVGLDAPALVVDVMVGRIVGRQVLQRIPGECVSAVVVDSLDGGEREEPHALAVGHTGGEERDARACSVQKESLNRVVIERPERVRYIEAVMAGMERHYSSQNQEKKSLLKMLQ